jgi:MoaA/NifB/PqqE/SkfB family radical SAM enzyme
METSMNSIEPVNPLGFQVAWEITLKCNMDCSYCGDGHNNKTLHPNKEECLKTVDFIALDLLRGIVDCFSRLSICLVVS